MTANISKSNLLEPMRLAYQGSALSSWWQQARQECLTLLPIAWQELLGAADRRVCIRVVDDQLYFYSANNGRLSLLGSLPSDDDELLKTAHARLQQQTGSPRHLLLDSKQVLRRILSLPLAAESKLREVVSFEIDRQTPFTLDQVYFEARVLSRSIQTKQCQVELIVLPKQALEKALKPLGILASDLSGVDVVDENQQTLNVNLLPNTMRAATSNQNAWLNLGLATAGFILLLLAMNLILDNREKVLGEWEQKVSAAEVQAKQANVFRNQLKQTAKAEAFLQKFRTSQPTMLALINDLTKRIPDDTSLDKLSVNEGRLVLVGQSKQAAALVSQLQSSPFINSPALVGAVQPDARTGRDRFTLTATVNGSKEASNGKPR
ncbi:MAG: PilN domain-containing protein [Arenimonas sp.]